MFKTKIALPFITLLFLSFLNWHCTKIDTTTIGAGLIPAVDNVNTFDTLITVIANTIDSSATDCPTIYPGEDHALGIIKNDPLFGTTQASIFVQMEPPFFPFYWPAIKTDMTLDSVVLVLSYRGAYGDSTIPQKVDVHEISNTFTPDSSSCSTYGFNSAILGSAIYTPQRLSDSVKVTDDTSSNQLRIKLSNAAGIAFGQKLLLQDSSSTGAFNNDSTYKLFSKGFAIVPDASFTGNALTYYNLTDLNTKLAVYFKYKRAGLSDTAVVYYFAMGLFGFDANNIAHNHTGSEMSKYVTNVPRPLGDTVIYLQNSPGTYAQIQLQGLDKLSNRIIHRAELTMEEVYSPSTLDNIFIAPDFLYLDMKDSTNGFYHNVPCDLVTTNGVPDISSFGGVRTNFTDSLGHTRSKYIFNLSRYIQKIVTTHRSNATLRLRAPTYISTTIGFTDDCGLITPPLAYPLNDPAFGRVKMGGGNSTNYRMKLRIIYSKL